jgi:arsenate reductase
MTTPLSVLVLCTGNSARSIMGEVLFNARGRGRVKAASAGSRPTGQVNPLALETLRAHALETGALESKSWDVFGPDSADGGTGFDLVVTVCASAAGETCPVWPGAPARANWAIPDPAAVAGAQARAAFEEAFARLDAMVTAFLAAPVETMDRAALQAHARSVAA